MLRRGPKVRSSQGWRCRPADRFPTSIDMAWDLWALGSQTSADVHRSRSTEISERWRPSRNSLERTAMVVALVVKKRFLASRCAPSPIFGLSVSHH